MHVGSVSSFISGRPVGTFSFHSPRENLKKLIVTVNRQKDILKKNGIVVDGKRYTVDFKGKMIRTKTTIFRGL